MFAGIVKLTIHGLELIPLYIVVRPELGSWSPS
jgi:hypothetical protein